MILSINFWKGFRGFTMLLKESQANDDNLDKLRYLLTALEREKEKYKHTILIVDDEIDNLQF